MPAAVLLALVGLLASPTTALEPGEDGLAPAGAVVACAPDEARHEERWEAGRVRERGPCADGLAQGGWTSWYPDGTRAWRGWLEQGALEGRFDAWFPSGERRARASYAGGLLEGMALTWWDTGRMRAVGRYEAGQAQGCHTTWRADGHLAARGAYVDGLRVGRWLTWDEDGHRQVEELDGKPSTGRCFRLLLP
ncbi:MAG: hypothetical protein ABIO70_36375 [Pseudomonadota bacterium]